MNELLAADILAATVKKITDKMFLANTKTFSDEDIEAMRLACFSYIKLRESMAPIVLAHKPEVFYIDCTGCGRKMQLFADSDSSECTMCKSKREKKRARVEKPTKGKVQ